MRRGFFLCSAGVAPRVLATASEDIPYPRLPRCGQGTACLAALQRMHPVELTVISGHPSVVVGIMAAFIIVLAPLLYASAFFGGGFREGIPRTAA
jgi:hypothetical protein